MATSSSSSSSSSGTRFTLLEESQLSNPDKINISTDKQQQVVFQWLSILEKELSQVKSADELKAQQSAIEKLLKLSLALKCVAARPIRQLISRCYLIIYRIGDGRTLYDTCNGWLTQLMNSLTKGIILSADYSKVAILHNFGTLLEAFGPRILSISIDSVATLIKIIQKSDKDLSIKLEAIYSLSKALNGVGKGLNEQTFKDAFKAIKTLFADKHIMVKETSAKCMESLLKNSPIAIPLSDIESVVSLSIKNFEDSNFSLRKALSSLIATSLASTQKFAGGPTLLEPVKKAKKPASPTKDGSESSSPETGKIWSTTQMLEVLSKVLVSIVNQSKPSVIVGVAESYSALFTLLGSAWIKEELKHITNHIVSLASNRQLISSEKIDQNQIKTICSLLMRQVHSKTGAGESALSASVTFLCDWLKSHCPKKPAEAKPETILEAPVILDELSNLFLDMGSSAASLIEGFVDNAETFLSFPDRRVQLSTAHCLKCLVDSQPSLMERITVRMFEGLESEFATIGSESETELMAYFGRATGLAAVLTSIKDKPLYLSFKTMSRIFSWCISTLRASLGGSSSSVPKDEKDLINQCLHQRLAWLLLTPLMSVHPNFIKVNATQIFLLWNSVFNRISMEDPIILMLNTDYLWQVFLDSRLEALTALYAYLYHQSHLVGTTSVISTETSKKTVKMLENAIFLMRNIFPPNVEFDRSAIFSKRIFQICLTLPSVAHFEGMHEVLLNVTKDVFLQGSVGSSLVYGIVNSDDISIAGLPVESTYKQFEIMLMSVACGGIEYDDFFLISNVPLPNGEKLPLPAAVSIIDVSMELFVNILSEQIPENQGAFLEVFVSTLKQASTQAKKNLVQKIICEMNVVTVFYHLLRQISLKRLTFSGERSLVLGQEILQGSLVHVSPLLRCVACETLGRLVKCVNNESFSNSVIQALVEQVINNKDPEARSSYGLALASIYRQVGGMAATSHLKTIVSMLHSLSSDHNHIVHTWALHALWLTMESAGLMFSSYLSITGSLLQKLLMSDHHDPLHHAALDSPFQVTEVYQILAKILNSYLGILGPELATSASTRGQCSNFMDYFMKTEDPFVVSQALRCLQQFLLLAPKTVEVPVVLPLLQSLLLQSPGSDTLVVKKACITCIRQLVQREPVTISTSSQLIEEQLLSLLDFENDVTLQDEVKDVLIGLLKATGSVMPSLWINLTRDCLARAAGAQLTSRSNGTSGAVVNESEDESGAESNASKSTRGSPTKTDFNFLFLQTIRSPFPKWRTQLFSVKLLRLLLGLFPKGRASEHTDLALAMSRKKQLEIQKRASASAVDFAVFRVQDLIKIAFNAATHSVDDLRMDGLYLLQDVIEKFSAGRDPEFENHSLLEQYQAQISSALSPAFSTEVSPEVQAVGITVCAMYVGSGISEDLASLSRAIKLLSGRLEKIKASGVSIDFGSSQDKPSLNYEGNNEISIMLHLSVLVAWADLFVASQKQQKYLEKVVQPQLKDLAGYWINALKDYVTSKIEVESVNDFSLEGVNLPSTVTSSQILMPFYEKSWLQMLLAVGYLVKSGDKATLETLMITSASIDIDGSDVGSHVFEGNQFHLIYGICFQVLASNFSIPTEKLSSIVQVLCFIFDKRLFPEGEFLDKILFLELITVMDRLIQAEEYGNQILMVKLLEHVVNSFGDTFLKEWFEEEEDGAADDAILLNIYKLLIHAATLNIPTLTNSIRYQPPVKRRENLLLSIPLLNLILDVMMSVWGVIPDPSKSQILAINLKVFHALMRVDKFSTDIVANKVLANYKAMLESIGVESQTTDYLGAFVVAISSFSDATTAQPQQPTSDIVQMKNNLLVCVLTMTIYAGARDFGPKVHSSYLNLIKRYLEMCKGAAKGMETVAVVAMQCLRTLCGSFFGKSSGNQKSLNVAAFYFSQMAPILLSDNEIQGNENLLIEAVKIFNLVMNVCPNDDSKASLLTLVLPFYVKLVKCSKSSLVSSSCTSAMFQWATNVAFKDAFKSVVTEMSFESKSTLENAIRSASASAK